MVYMLKPPPFILKMVLVSLLIDTVTGQYMIFEETIRTWFMDDYDIGSSTCETDAGCKEGEKCGLIEIYLASKINISRYVKETRSKQCV